MILRTMYVNICFKTSVSEFYMKWILYSIKIIKITI